MSSLICCVGTQSNVLNYYIPAIVHATTSTLGTSSVSDQNSSSVVNVAVSVSVTLAVLVGVAITIILAAIICVAKKSRSKIVLNFQSDSKSSKQDDIPEIA